MAAEIELKLAFPPAARETVLAHLRQSGAEALGRQTLTNTYFDTPGLELSAQRIALRTRKAGNEWLQTVKCAAESIGGLSARPEWEHAYAGRFDFSAVDAPAVRAQLESLQARLVPLFTTDFERDTLRLCPATGVEILLMLDAGEVGAQGGRETISELELELVSGTPDDLLALACALAAELPLRAFDASKAARGYRLFRAEALVPQGSVAQPARAKDDPREYFRRTALALLATASVNLEGALLADEAEFVHQARVALARLRTLLRLFSPYLPEAFTRPALSALHAQAGLLADLRDLQVLEELLHAAREGDSDKRLPGLITHNLQARRSAQAVLRARLTATGAGLPLLAFHRAVLALPPSEEGPPMKIFARLAMNSLLKEARRHLREADRTREAAPLHALRGQVRRLRHACEFFAPIDKRWTRQARRMARLQGRLGQLNDLAVAMPRLGDWARAEPALADGVAFVAGWLSATSLKLRRTILPGSRKQLARSRWR